MRPYRILLAFSLGRDAAAEWLYKQSSCTIFQTCQTCVVEFGPDSSKANNRNECGWCPDYNLSTQRCRLMDPVTGSCPNSGKRYQNTCLITASFPSCVDLKYSFWFCDDIAPQNRFDSACITTSADPKCTLVVQNEEVKICNGQSFLLESVGAASRDALHATKNQYGLEIKLLNLWAFFDGEDRRRIETNYITSRWMCNAKTANLETKQTTVVNYAVSASANQDPGPIPEGGTPADDSCPIPLFCSFSK